MEYRNGTLKQLYSKENSFDLGCYAQRFGARGYGHIGGSSIGLMSDIKDKEWQRYFAIPYIHV